MDFYTSYSEARPVRLSADTRQFAYDSLHHKYGTETRSHPAVSLDHIEGISEMPMLDQYDIAIREIVLKAPIRICKNERISGAATLGWAIKHCVPATIAQNALCGSVSHLTIDFPTVLKIGCGGIRQNIIKALGEHTEPDKVRFLQSALHCMDCLKIWHSRYVETLKEMPEYRKNYENLCRVPFGTPRNFYEAVQSIWFVFAFVRLCGNWPGIGRLDLMLGDYLKRDLRSGALTLGEAREILAHFFIKGCEWITGGNCESGDAQHYQNIVLAGVDENGAEITNEVTYLVLDIIEELGISDFPTTVRVNGKTDEKLLRRAAEVIRHGGGVLAVYNEDLILRSLTDFGYSLSEARTFANDGCWEVQIPGKTCFSYVPFDSLAVLQRVTLKEYSPEEEFADFDELYAKYLFDLEQQTEQIYKERTAGMEREDASPDGWSWKKSVPCTVVSLFEDGCIKAGRSYFEGGPRYTVCSPHIGGLPDTANSLYAIKKLIYDDKALTFQELMNVLRNNWEGAEALRQYAAAHYVYYGNDNDEVDLLAARLLKDFSEKCSALNGRCPILFPAGVSTFGRQLGWAPHRYATPYGKKRGAVLAGNLSPTPGTDKTGATAVIKSYCKADLSLQQTGAALDIRLLPHDVKGEDGIQAIVSLINGFVSLGGFFMQMDVADGKILMDAQLHPENYQTLSVRVSGWNARFVTLNKEWQDMIIREVNKS